MMKGYNRLQAMLLTASDHVQIMLGLSIVEGSFAGFDAGPLHGEPISVQAGLSHKPDILLITVVMIHCVQRGFRKAGVLHLLHGPVIAVRVVAFHLVCRDGGAQQEVR